MVFQRGYLEFQAAGFPAWGSRLRIHEGSGSAFKVLCLGGGGRVIGSLLDFVG